MTRRSFLKFSLQSTGVLALLGVGSAVYATRIEPNALVVEPVTVQLDRLPSAFDGLTIAHISDLHFGGWMNAERMATVVKRINALNPDVVAITGDFVTRITPQMAHEMAQTLGQLCAPEGVFGVFGNHDHWTNAQRVGDALAAGGVRVLVNESVTLHRDGAVLVIAGLDDIWENRQDLNAALRDSPPGAAVVLLVHEPDYAHTVAEDGRVGLQLSGHTHGGQIRLPGIGALVLPQLGRDFDQGLFRLEGGLQVYVTRGVGMLSPAVRFLCPPEITLITLKTSAS